MSDDGLDPPHEFGVEIELIDDAWCVFTRVDDQRRVVSRHRSRAAATEAARVLDDAHDDIA